MVNTGTQGQKIGLVIVDDAPVLLRVYKRFFESVGLRVNAIFSNQHDLLSFLASHKGIPDDAVLASSIVLLDYDIAGIGTEELARRLRELNAHQKIIVMTHEDPSTLKFDAKLINSTIQKPFMISELFEIIESLMTPLPERGTVVINDSQEMQWIMSAILSDTTDNARVCLNPARIKNGLDVSSYAHTFLKASEKGLKVSIITQIGRETLTSCKELMAYRGIELRHLEGIVKSFSVYDQKHFVEATVLFPNSPMFKQLVYSNLPQIVSKNQYLFDELWKMATPAAERIRELEGGSIDNMVRVIFGANEISQTSLQFVQNARSSLNLCVSSALISGVLIPELKQAYADSLVRGVKCRVITEVTSDTSSLTKSLIDSGVEVRHLSNLRGLFEFNEKEIIATVTKEDKQTKEPAAILYSNYSEFIELHRTIFDALWRIATPATTRLEDIRRDPQESSKASVINSIG